MRRLSILTVPAACLMLATSLPGLDWPQFRHDAARSGASSEPLAGELHLQWVRELEAPRPAFPNEIRLLYDASYEPVVLGKTLFVPSMVTDTVTALDTETGGERWRFFADGPVRFAPVAWQGKVYFVSDDGFLYCVNAANGALLWKFRQLPEGQSDRKLLGHHRLISLRPARGAPVLADGVIYFATGIWSSHGVFVHALDAETGRALWSTATDNRIPRANMDHGVANFAGLSPQGYLAIVGGKLIVPCGNALPALLDLKTGELGAYTMGWGGRNGLPKGSWFVAGAGNYLTTSGDLYDIETPNQERFPDTAEGRRDFKPMLYPGGVTRLEIDPTNQKGLGVFEKPVITQDTLFSYDGEVVVAESLVQGEVLERATREVSPQRRDDTYPDKQVKVFHELWKYPSKHRVFIKAGPRLYTGGPGVVEALEVPSEGGTPRVPWSAKVDGTPQSMLAADGKLFVVTGDGRVHAFGAQARAQPTVHPKPSSPLSEPDAWTEKVTAILAETATSEGYALVLGIGTGRLVEELLRQSSLAVIAVDPDEKKVSELRAKFLEAGLYGSRISIHAGDPMEYPFPPLLAGLVVSEDLASSGAAVDGQSAKRIFRLLRPYGGTACLEVPADQRGDVAKVLFDQGLPGLRVHSTNEYTLITRGGALPDSADWSHSGANAANTGASRELSVRPPVEMLWFHGSHRWIKEKNIVEVRVAGGRLLVLASKLHAIDVYTGRDLWEVALPGPGGVKRQIVALDDRVYVTAADACFVLDAVTGRRLQRIDLSETDPGTWSDIRVSGAYLVAACGSQLVCLDRRTGGLVWKHACGRANLSLAVGGGKVFCSELADARRGEATAKTRAFDLATGDVLWELDDGSEIRYGDRLDAVVTAKGVYHAQDGSRIRENALSSWILDDKLLSGADENFALYDVLTGATAFETLEWRRRGCTHLRASSVLVTTRVGGNAACIDLETRAFTPLWDIRSGCNNNLYPANGVLNVPALTLGCTCNYMPTSQAFVPASLLE